MVDFHIRPDCRLCSSTYTEVLNLGETALANEVWDDPSKQQDVFPLKLVQCDSCGHMQCPVVVDPKRLFGKYSYTSGLTESYREHLREYAGQINAYLGPDDQVVEIGGNDGTLGTFLDGRPYINVDPSDVDQPSGMRFTEFFTPEVAKRIRSDFGPAKVIVANHVFAHADDLHSMAEGVRELLADDGVFFVEVGHGPTQLRGGLSVVYHEHLSYHDERSLHAFFWRHGLFCKDISFNCAQGGSVRMRFAKQNDIGDMLGSPGFSPTGFDLPAIKAKAAEMRGLGKILRDVGDAYPIDVAVYGAPAKLTTLLSLLGMDESHIDTVFDDSPRKVGKHTPGSHIPIKAPTPTDVEECNYILIASWNFADSIMARYPGYTGTWVIPEPTVRFVPGGGD